MTFEELMVKKGWWAKDDAGMIAPTFETDVMPTLETAALANKLWELVTGDHTEAIGKRRLNKIRNTLQKLIPEPHIVWELLDD